MLSVCPARQGPTCPARLVVLRLPPAFRHRQLEVFKFLHPRVAGNWNLKGTASHGVGIEKLSGLELPKTAVGAAVPGSVRVSIRRRQNGHGMVAVRNGERTGDKNAMPGFESPLQTSQNRAKRVGHHHLTQDEVVAVETVLVNRRKGDDLCWPAIVARKRDGAFPPGNQNHIAGGSEGLNSGGQQVHIGVAGWHFIPIRQSRNA